MNATAPYEPVSLELYLEDIPTAQLEREALRRAYVRTEAALRLLEATLEHMREKQYRRHAEMARQDQRLLKPAHE